MTPEESLYRYLKGFEEANTRISFQRFLLKIQLASIGLLVLTFLFYLVVEFFKPDFFNITEWWVRTDSIIHGVMAFWPMYIWALFWAMYGLLGFDGHMSEEDRTELFALETTTSILAGVWEEIGFRCLFIFTAMIGVWFFNLIWGTVMTVVVGIMLLCVLFGLVGRSIGAFIGGAFFLAIYGTLLYFMWDKTNPIYWLYDNLVFPITNFFTLGYLKDVLYDRSVVSFLFIAGAISANAKFRDGHKYQGLIGYTNSWFIGCVMIYCLVHYGLVVCIMSHAIYDLVFAFMNYFVRGYQYRLAHVES